MGDLLALVLIGSLTGFLIFSFVAIVYGLRSQKRFASLVPWDPTPPLLPIQTQDTPTVQPPSVQPPTVQPPSVQPPSVQPPSVQPPSVQPPSVQPPSVQPGTGGRYSCYSQNVNRGDVTTWWGTQNDATWACNQWVSSCDGTCVAGPYAEGLSKQTVVIPSQPVATPQKNHSKKHTMTTPAHATTPAPAHLPSTGLTFMPYYQWGSKVPSEIKNVTFAFITSAHGKPSWEAGGSSGALVSEIKALKARGGRFRISFGGADSIELAQAIKDVTQLTGAYQSVINTYGATWLDFDIEGKATSDTSSIDRRNASLAQLQKSNPGLKIDYTLAVMPSGLENVGKSILTNAKSHGVHVNCVNIMAMDYGGKGDMGAWAIQAAQSTKKQIDALGLSGTTVGITPMIGVNDVKTEVFSLENAKAVVAFAKSTPWVTLLAFWEVAADKKFKYGYTKVFSS